jgi:hypothetical protein
MRSTTVFLDQLIKLVILSDPELAEGESKDLRLPVFCLSFWRSPQWSRHSGAAPNGVVILAQPESPYLFVFARHSEPKAQNPRRCLSLACHSAA